MDTFEIMTSIRNTLDMHTEKQLPTRVLLRYINNAYKEIIIPELFDHIRDKVYTESELDDQTGSTVAIPALCDKIVSVKRGDYDCIEVPLHKKNKIGESRGRILQYPDDDTKHPLYLVEGSNITIYPTLTTTDVVIAYKKRIPPLEFSRGTVTTTNLVLDNNAMPVDDIYNNYYFALYSESGLVLTLSSVGYYATDYDGATRTITLNGSPGDGSYICAMIPIIPDVFHSFIADATLVHLARARIYDDNPSNLWMEVKYNLQEAQNAFVKA